MLCHPRVRTFFEWSQVAQHTHNHAHMKSMLFPFPAPNNTARDTLLYAHTATLVSTSTSHRHEPFRSASSLCRGWVFLLSLPSKNAYRYFLSMICTFFFRFGEKEACFMFCCTKASSSSIASTRPRSEGAFH